MIAVIRPGGPCQAQNNNLAGPKMLVLANAGKAGETGE